MPAPRVARKTATTIQDGSMYKERYLLGYAPPAGSTVRQVFILSDGSDIAEITGEIDGHYATFKVPYADVEAVPNAAGFYCYVHEAGDDPADEHMVRYGTVFRRELTFPNSPAVAKETVVRSFEDSFQRPEGPVGSRWKVLRGQPRIFDNGAKANTVGPNYNFLSNYFMRYYQPFNDDTVELSISAFKKGAGRTVVALCGNADMSSYLFALFSGQNNTVTLGIGHSPDLGSELAPNAAALELKTTATPLAVPDINSNTIPGSYRLRYDDATARFAFWQGPITSTPVVSFVDTNRQVPHGKGYRYFGVGGTSTLFNSGVQIAYVNAMGKV